MLPTFRGPSQKLLIGLATLSICATALGAAPASASASTAAPESGQRGWQSVWRDDFNGPAGSGVNPVYWNYDLGQGVWGTGEIEP